MFKFFKWIFDANAPVRPGCFSQVGLLISAAFAIPGISAMLLAGPLRGLMMLLGSLVPIILFALPAWNAYRKNERVQALADANAIKSAPVQPVPEPEIEKKEDEYSGLRENLRASNQTEALKQLDLFLEKMDDFNSVLSLKFKPNEVTWHRYQDSSAKVFDGAVRNIESVAAFGRSVRMIDGRALKEQLDVMIANEQGDSRAAVAIRERLGMMSEGQKHIEALLGSNEEALTSLTRVTTRLASITTEGTGVTSSDMDAMIEDLDAMASRTERYNVSLKDAERVIIEPTR